MAVVIEFEGIQCTTDEILAELCKASYVEFIKEFWDEVPSAEKLIWNWHMDVLATEMETAARRVFAGLPCEYDSIFNTVFGTSKSTICSVLFQPWTWTIMPSARHMTGSHTEPLGTDLAGKSLAVIKSEKYQTLFPHVVLDKKGDGHFTNTHGGERRTCTVGGKTPTGFHAHFLGIDDPIDPKGAMSQAELENAAHFVENVLPSRKVNKLTAWTYLVMQRLGRGDPTEVMVKAGEKEGAIPVRRIVLPGEISPDIWPLELRENYIDGLLDPHRLPRVVLNNYRSKGAMYYAAQVMQNPLALGGGMFRVGYFNHRVKSAPYHATRVRSWDRACLVAGTMVETSQGQKPIEKVTTDDFVLTRQGYKRVLWSGLTKKVSELTKVCFSNGAELKGTSDHPIWTENRGWINLSDVCSVRYTSSSEHYSFREEQTCLKRESNLLRILKPLSSTGWLTQEDLENVTSKRIDIAGRRKEAGPIFSIVPYGDFITGGFRKDMMSTMLMGTGTTMTSAISNACREQITTGITALLPSGTKLRRQTYFVEGMFRKHGGICRGGERNVSSAGRNLNQGIPIRRDFAFVPSYAERGFDVVLCLKDALSVPLSTTATEKPALKSVPMKTGKGCVLSAERNSKRRDELNKAVPVSVATFSVEETEVYDLTVENAHEFFANGILVHNSTEGAGCATAGTLMAATATDFYVEHCIAGQWEPNERNDIMLATALKDRARYGPSNEPTIVIEEEGGSTAADARKVIANKLAGFRVLFVHPTGSKDVRAEPWSAQLAAGNVYIVDNGESSGQGKADWDIPAFVDEHCLFRPEPGKRLGAMKDRVDSASQAFTWLVNTTRTGTMRTYTFGLNDTKQIAQRIVVCSVEQLKEVVIHDPAIFIHSADPTCDNNDSSSSEEEVMCNGTRPGRLRNRTDDRAVHVNGVGHQAQHDRPSLPAHALVKLLSSGVLVHADIMPSECQDNWEELIPPWNLPVEELVLRSDEAKRLWSSVLKKYDTKWRILVLSDSGGNDRRALSLAYCVCDVLRLPRTQTIYRVGHEGWQATTKDDVPNRHVYETAKQARSMVI